MEAASIAADILLSRGFSEKPASFFKINWEFNMNDYYKLNPNKRFGYGKLLKSSLIATILYFSGYIF